MAGAVVAENARIRVLLVDVITGFCARGAKDGCSRRKCDVVGDSIEWRAGRSRSRDAVEAQVVVMDVGMEGIGVASPSASSNSPRRAGVQSARAQPV